MSNLNQGKLNFYNPAQEEKTRNILNDGKQLSLITVCSDVLDHSADLKFDMFKEDSNASAKDEEEEYLTF